MQRIRIGLTGLAFVFLLVLLGTVVSRSGRDGPIIPNAVNNSPVAAEPSDPLSDLGVAPRSPGNEAGNAVTHSAR